MNLSRFKPTNIDIFSLLLLWITVFPFALSSVVLPHGRDQGIYAYSASQFLHGNALYEGIYVFKPPMTVFMHVASQLVFGHSMTAIRSFDIPWTLATVTALYFFVSRGFKSPTAGVFAGAIWAILYHSKDYWTGCQTDGWATLPLALAFFSISTSPKSEHRWIPSLLSGLALSVAFWFKYTFLTPLPWLVIVPLLIHGRAGLRDSLMVAVGFATGIGLMLGFLGLTGGLSEFISTQLGVTLPYTDTRKTAVLSKKMGWFLDGAQRYGTSLWMGAIPGVLAGAVVAVAHFRRRNEDPRWITAMSVCVWTITAFLSVWVQGKFFVYQYLPLLAPLAILLSWPAAWLLEQGAERFLRRPAFSLIALPFLCLILTQKPFVGRIEIGKTVWTGKGTLEGAWRKKRYIAKTTSMAQSLAIAKYIQNHSMPDDSVYLWSYDPVILFLADRQIPTRFLYTYPLVISWGDPAYRTELVEDLKRDPPVVFGCAGGDATPTVMGHRKDSKKTFQEFTELSKFIEENYTIDKKISNYQMYLRNDTAKRLKRNKALYRQLKQPL